MLYMSYYYSSETTDLFRIDLVSLVVLITTISDVGPRRHQQFLRYVEGTFKPIGQFQCLYIVFSVHKLLYILHQLSCYKLLGTPGFDVRHVGFTTSGYIGQT